MRLSAKSEYAVKALLDLALHATGDLQPIQDIAARQGIPQRYLEQRGHPRLRARHGRFAIEQRARDRWMTLMTEALAEAIYSHLKHRDVLLASLLVQIKAKSRKQHQCTTDAERAENVKDIYAVTQSGLMTGKCVILVDDVLTSGATMRECADVLKASGAKSVMGIALARTERAKAPLFAFSDGGWPGGDAA